VTERRVVFPKNAETLYRQTRDSQGCARIALNDRAIAEVVKRATAVAGYDPARFGGHSLRAGLATTAAAAGVDERTIMEQAGHKTTTMVRRYMRRGSLFRNNAAAKVGL